MAQKTMSEKEFRGHIKGREGDFELGLDYLIKKDGKRVWPDDNSYDAHTSTKNVGILRYGNGKFAGHTDDEDILYVLSEKVYESAERAWFRLQNRRRR